ncbi:MAG: CBS domain-containing protein [Anaeromyxobacter sp.]
MQLREVMSQAQGCREDDTAQSCARFMKEQNVGFAPICNQAGEPVGAITDRDLAIRVLADGRPAGTPISQVMTRDVVSCRLDDDLEEAKRLMRERRLSRIMVCDEQGRLQGVVALADLTDLDSEEEIGQTLQEVKSDSEQQPTAH